MQLIHLTISILTHFLPLFGCHVQGIQLPRPKGPFEIGTTTFELTDHSRLDPFAPTAQNRSVELSIHYPIPHGSTLPISTYLPFLTAQNIETQFALPAGTLQNISTHAHLDSSILSGGNEIPVILFSPGMGDSRLIYTTFVQDLASEGYVVVSIDHPYDASIVELSDGRVIAGNIPDTPDAVTLDVAVRAADARFVLDELATGENFHVPGLKKGLDTSRVGFFGHSLGGATAANAMALDYRIIGGVDMDGSLFGTDVLRGFAKPFFIMGREGHNRTTDSTWAEVWLKLRGFKREIEVRGTLHGTFTDGPVLADLLGVKLEDIFGTIAAQEFDRIQHAYLTAFFNFVLKGTGGSLLNGPSKKFPDVTFDP